MTSRKRQSKSSLSSRRIKRQRGLQRRLSQPRRVALAKVKDDLSRYLKLAADQEILITRHGRPAGVLIGFKSEDDWFEYRLENHPEFLRRIQAARQALQAGLVNRVLPKGELEAYVHKLAKEMAQNAPLTVQGAKRFSLIPQGQVDTALSERAFLSQDFQEGVKAYLEKRPPRFQGS